MGDTLRTRRCKHELDGQKIDAVEVMSPSFYVLVGEGWAGVWDALGGNPVWDSREGQADMPSLDYADMVRVAAEACRKAPPQFQQDAFIEVLWHQLEQAGIKRILAEE